jgi:phasin family protein
MAESPDNAVKSVENAHAAAAARAQPAQSEIAEVEAAPVANDQPTTDAASTEAPRSKPAARKAPVKKKSKPASKKPVAKVSRTISKPRRRPAPRPQASAASAPRFTVSELKEKIMATAKTADFTKPFADAISDAQSKAKAAYDQSAAFAAEATEFAKGNVEAVVESTKVYAAGVQDLGKTYAEEAKAAFETLTADVKELAAVKSPAELFQLQARLARRNFDALVAYSSKSTDAVSKLATEAFAPISGRLSLAAEKIAKAA